MITKFFRLGAWACLAVILFVTASPIGLRPEDVMSVDVDRALAFALMAALFIIAYPRYFGVIALVMILSPGIIEPLQLLSPSRHAHLSDAVVKMIGAATGVVTGWLVLRLANALRDSGLKEKA